MFSLFRRRESFEERVAVLAECGIALRAGIPPEALLSKDPKEARRRRREFERKGERGYVALLFQMGAYDLDPLTDEVTPPRSDDVWYLDTECIENPGDYKALVERFCALTRGDLVYDRIEDHLDFDENVAWVELTRNGKTRRIDLEVNDDWVDVMFFEAMYDELAATGSGRKFRLVSDAPELTYICQTPEQIDVLRRRTGLKI